MRKILIGQDCWCLQEANFCWSARLLPLLALDRTGAPRSGRDVAIVELKAVHSLLDLPF